MNNTHEIETILTRPSIGLCPTVENISTYTKMLPPIGQGHGSVELNLVAGSILLVANLDIKCKNACTLDGGYWAQLSQEQPGLSEPQFAVERWSCHSWVT